MLITCNTRCDMDAFLVLLNLLIMFWIPAIPGEEITNPVSNRTNSTNDMYVIQATVYQVGIITNKSEEEFANMTGNEEALSFYHNNGSTLDLSNIPAPLVTNVTAQSAVAVAPVQTAPSDTSGNTPLGVLDQLRFGKRPPIVKRSENMDDEEYFVDDRAGLGDGVYLSLFKRSSGNFSTGGPTIKVVKETSLIPPEVGLKSIGLPELVGLNTSLASVPLPIPNTSVVRYSKVNTLVTAP